MSAYSRFHCPSSSLSLRALLKQTRRILWIGFLLALGVHLSLIQLRGLSEAEKAVKPLTTQFIKRAPRLTKPLEMKKRPQPKRRRIQRKMVAVKAQVKRQDLTSRVQTVQVVQSLARPTAEVSRFVGKQSMAMEPETIAQEVLGSMNTKQVVDMSLEMVDTDALDTGRYQAMVIQDPADRRVLRGYFHLHPVYIESAAAAEARCTWGKGAPFAFPNTFRNLVFAMNDYTDIKTDLGDTFGLSSPNVHKVPIIFVSYHIAFEASPAECRNVGAYLLAGGFLFSDTLLANAKVVYRNIRLLWQKSLESVGKAYGADWNFEKIPNSHALYHCYFDFHGPPVGFEGMYGQEQQWANVDYIDGVFMDGRLLGICTCKNYWNRWNWEVPRPRLLQFGVNIIIFALTQESSITNRVMDTVGY